MTPARLVTLVCTAQACAQIGAYTWPALMSRAVAGHAASIGSAGALSFMFAGLLNRWIGWRGAFAGAAVIAWLVVFLSVPARRTHRDASSGDVLFDFRPVLRNRSAMAFAVAYCAHTWEMKRRRLCEKHCTIGISDSKLSQMIAGPIGPVFA